MLEAGTWVEIKNRNANGFILETTYHNAMVFVIQDGKAKGKQVFNHSQLIEMSSDLASEDAATLKRLHINMALDTGDKEWFAELGGSMEESK